MSFAYYCKELRDWYAPPGTYSVLIGKSSRDIALTADVVLETSKRVPFDADINTTVADLLRIEGGEGLVVDLMRSVPWLASKIEKYGEVPLTDLIERWILQMVPRQTALMGPAELTFEKVKQMLDKHIK